MWGSHLGSPIIDSLIKSTLYREEYCYTIDNNLFIFYYTWQNIYLPNPPPTGHDATHDRVQNLVALHQTIRWYREDRQTFSINYISM